MIKYISSRHPGISHGISHGKSPLYPGAFLAAPKALNEIHNTEWMAGDGGKPREPWFLSW
jgi:hypothetical protein